MDGSSQRHTVAKTKTLIRYPDDLGGVVCNSPFLSFTVVDVGIIITFSMVTPGSAVPVSDLINHPFYNNISDGDIIDPGIVGTDFSIIAPVSPNFESVRFDYDGDRFQKFN